MRLSFGVSEWFFVLVSKFLTKIHFSSPPLKQTGNNIGGDGAAQIAEALKVNTTLTVLLLGCKWLAVLGGIFFVHVFCVDFVSISLVSNPIRQCNWRFWRETYRRYVESEHDTDFSWFVRWVVLFDFSIRVADHVPGYIEWLCLLLYRQSHWRQWGQKYCRSVESEFNTG